MDKKTSFSLQPHNGTYSALETCSYVPFMSNKLFVEINFPDESGCGGEYFLFLFLLGMESIALSLSSSMSIVPKLNSALNFFDLASKKCNWGGQTLSYSYYLLCPASILLHKHTLCYNVVLMVGFEQFFMNLELCTCKYNSHTKIRDPGLSEALIFH